MDKLKQSIESTLSATVAALGRPDLFRAPLVGYSSAEDKRYGQLKTIVGSWHRNPRELLPGANTVISCFVPFTKAVVLEPKTFTGASPLWADAYQIINCHFDVVGGAVAAVLHKRGFAALPIKATHTYDPATLQSAFSHRSAAQIAGLGSFGANSLLITQKGSGGRFCTVLTTAVLQSDLSPAPVHCLYMKDKSCGLCFKICPVNALGPSVVDKFACQDELNKNQHMLKQSGDYWHSADVCGKCISVCPLAYIE